MAYRFQFRLRTMFVLVAVLGAILGWLGVELKWIHDRHEALRWIAPLRARQLAAEQGAALPPRRGFYVTSADATVPWRLKLLGETGIKRLEMDGAFLGENPRYSLERLSWLFPEAEVSVITK